mmetsp:Transcript_9587/g.10925  ORF Transcript_9587/g.10925 Transcript_9587/m.10925 type:complete len:243 (+) Transcript_9587:163-891(+)|eukprot:CAMPEP_0184037738 /NCGR_PEP_ID=MMETSP0955-20130417/41884_1 /TAXON_ID=627963 /ORGANISM="Aplanochytrium sp, Strain PBS07" /LENGTH=242 /DNA_ID=CAMNT_0026325997 /DNA_START=119 /DNA_END=847 /DNA_ORIENTATION=+
MKAVFSLRLVLFCLVCYQNFKASEACLPDGAQNKVEIGKDTYVCLIVNNENVRSIKLKADEFSRFVIPNSFNLSSSCDDFFFPNGCENSTNSNSEEPAGQTQQSQAEESSPCESSLLSVASMGVTSQLQRAYVDCPPQHYFPVQTAVITVDMGAVTAITWDNEYESCPSSDFRNNGYNGTTGQAVSSDIGGESCAIPIGKCSGSSCDLTLYIVWRGRDVNGNYFGSTTFTGAISEYFTSFLT